MRNYEEAAQWLGVPLGWLQGKVQKREVPHTRLGKHVRFSRDNLEEIIQQAQIPARSERPTVVWTDEMRPISRGPRRKPG